MLEGEGGGTETAQGDHEEMDICLVEGLKAERMERRVLPTWTCDAAVLQRHRPHPLVGE
jgi:hypothetical protein